VIPPISLKYVYTIEPVATFTEMTFEYII